MIRSVQELHGTESQQDFLSTFVLEHARNHSGSLEAVPHHLRFGYQQWYRSVLEGAVRQGSVGTELFTRIAPEYMGDNALRTLMQLLPIDASIADRLRTEVYRQRKLDPQMLTQFPARNGSPSDALDVTMRSITPAPPNIDTCDICHTENVPLHRTITVLVDGRRTIHTQVCDCVPAIMRGDAPSNDLLLDIARHGHFVEDDELTSY